MKEKHIQSLGQEDSVEKEMSTHSNILARKIPWTCGCKKETKIHVAAKETDMTNRLNNNNFNYTGLNKY